MAIDKTIFKVVASLIFLFSFCTVYAESFKIKSLENNPVAIEVKADHLNNKLYITYGRRCFAIPEFMNLSGEIIVESEQFLKVSYTQRSGVGMKIVNTILFCVDRNELYESMMITSSYHEQVVNTFSGKSDSLALNHEMNKSTTMRLEKKSSFFIRLNIDEEYTSLNSAGENYKGDDSLLFDTKRRIFYNCHQKLKGVFTILKPNESLVKKKLDGDYFCIKLRDNTFLFLDGEWMELGRSNVLLSNRISCSK